MASRLYYHLVWTTRNRAPLIDAGLATFLARCLRDLAAREGAQLLEIGMVTTHVHILIAAPPTTSLPHLIQVLKGATSHLAHKEGHSTTGATLRWAKGYHMSTVGPRQLGLVCDYLRNQHRHHPGQAIAGWLSSRAAPSEHTAPARRDATRV